MNVYSVWNKLQVKKIQNYNHQICIDELSEFKLNKVKSWTNECINYNPTKTWSLYFQLQAEAKS